MELQRIPRDHLQVVVKALQRTARYWWVGILAVAIGGAATFVLERQRPKQYASEAVLYYQEGMQWGAGGEGGMSTRRVGQRLKDMLLARKQLLKMIDELHLYPKLMAAGNSAEAVEEMRLATSFKANEGDIFVISFTGEDPEEAQKVTGALTDTLIDENTRLRSEQAEVAKSFLDLEKKRNEDNLRTKDLQLARFLAKHPEFATEQAGSSGAAIRATTKKNNSGEPPAPIGGDPVLTTLRREEERLKRQIESPAEVPRAVQDPVLVSAKNEAEAKLAAARKDLAEKKFRFTDQHPDVRAAAAYVAECEEAYNRAAAAAKASATTMISEIEPKSVLEARLNRVQDEIATYLKKKPKDPVTGTVPERTETNDAAQKIVETEAEWAQVNREVAEAKERFQQLDTRQFMASMAASSLIGGQAAKIIVIDPAFLPAHPIGLSRTKFVLLGLATALAIGLGLALICGILDDRIYDAVDVEQLNVVPVLVEVQPPAGVARARARASKPQPRPRPAVAAVERART